MTSNALEQLYVIFPVGQLSCEIVFFFLDSWSFCYQTDSVSSTELRVECAAGKLPNIGLLFLKQKMQIHTLLFKKIENSSELEDYR